MQQVRVRYLVSSIGIVIVAGLAIGTLFTLFVLPVIYSYIASEHKPLPVFDENVKNQLKVTLTNNIN